MLTKLVHLEQAPVTCITAISSTSNKGQSLNISLVVYFLVSSFCSPQSKEPWKLYLIPNVKSDRLKYFNSMTEEIYKAAYTSKQTKFQSYLDGQRRYRWSFNDDLEEFENRLAKYTDGIIPKENINCARYREFPVDVQVEDVKKCERALSYINNSLTEIKEEIEKLVNRKRELFDDEPRTRASNEIEFVNSNLNKIDCLATGTYVIAQDIQYVFHQLEKRFDAASIRSNEQKRKARRHIE